MNVAYKHLDAKLRIAELTVGQWFAVLVGLGVAFVWGFYLSPLGGYLTLFTAVYLGALPVGAVLMAGMSELDVGLMVRSAVRWSRQDGRYVPGPGRSARGYVVLPAADAEPTQRDPFAFDLASLWDD